MIRAYIPYFVRYSHTSNLLILRLFYKLYRLLFQNTKKTPSILKLTNDLNPNPILSQEKPHKCGVCSKSFPTPGDLRSHMYVHNGRWPHRCSVCDRGFSKATNLRNHMLMHSGEKPNQCPRCGKKFALAANPKTHLKTHESE